MLSLRSGQRIWVRSYHLNCSWCTGVHGKEATVLTVKPFEKGEPVLLEAAVLAQSSSQLRVFLKPECVGGGWT